MQINKLELENFKGAAQISTTLNKYNVLCGPNGAGKSSTLEALRCVITGKAPADVITAGQTTCNVRADIEGVGLIERSFGVKNEARVNKRKTTAKSITESMQHMLGISPQVSNILTSSQVLAAMSSKEFGEFLLNEGLLRIDADIERVVEHCTLSKEAEHELRKHLPKYPMVITTKMLDDAYTYFDNTRKQLKREMDALARKAAYVGVIPPLSTAEINAERAHISESLGAIQAAQDLYHKNIASYNKHIGLLKEVRDKADGITADRPHPATVDACRSRCKELTDLISLNERTLHMQDYLHSLQEQALANLEKSSCPVCTEVRCTLDTAAAKQALRHALSQYMEERGHLEKTVRGMKEQHAECVQQLKEYEEQTALADKKELLLEQAETLEQTLPPEPLEPSDRDKDDLLSKQIYLDEQYALAVRYEDAMEAKVQRDAKEEKLKIVAELTRALSPSEGVRQRLLEHQRTTLQDYCNERARLLLPKYNIVLDTKSGMGISLKSSEENIISLEAASKSEKIRVMLILMDMVNVLSGFRLLILDDLESLDSDNLAALMKLLTVEEVRESYDHIFLAGVNHEEFVQATNHLPEDECCYISAPADSGREAA